jgi:hypothetical protein
MNVLFVCCEKWLKFNVLLKILMLSSFHAFFSLDQIGVFCNYPAWVVDVIGVVDVAGVVDFLKQYPVFICRANFHLW